MFNLLENCSVCINTKSILIKISGTDTNQVQLSDKLRLCVPEVDWGDDCCICPICIEQLDIAYTFYHLCLQSYEVRKQQQPFVVKTEEPPLDSKEIYDFKVISPITVEIHGSNNEFDDFSSEANSVVKKDPLEDLPEINKAEILVQLKTEELHNNEIENTNEENSEKPIKSKYPKNCDYCSKQFNRKQHLDAHVRTYHTLEKPYACDSCPHRFTTLDKLKGHERKHTNTRRFVCSTCGKSYVSSSGFYQHTQSHLNKREYKCDLCEKTFNTTSILGSHKLCVHIDPQFWKYQCTFCEKKFPMKSGFMAHVRRHTGEKNFACHICIKRFVDKDSLINHVRSHTDERLFKCHLCVNEYKTKKALSIHLKKHHDIGTVTVPKPRKKHECKQCSKAFTTMSKLEIHIRTHTGERPFSCHICKKKFKDGWYLKVHLRKKHGKDSISDNSDSNLDNS